MDRAEHMTWVRERALAELDAGGPRAVINATSSLVSDLAKHPETRGHTAIELTGLMQLGGHLRTDADVRDWINGVQ